MIKAFLIVALGLAVVTVFKSCDFHHATRNGITPSTPAQLPTPQTLHQGLVRPAYARYAEATC